MGFPYDEPTKAKVTPAHVESLCISTDVGGIIGITLEKSKT